MWGKLREYLGIDQIEKSTATLSLEIVILKKDMHGLKEKIKSLEDERKEYKTELAMIQKLKNDKPKVPAFQYRRIA